MDAFESRSPEETRRFAEELARGLEEGTVVLLFGDLGAGKTTFVQGLARGLGVPEDCYVASPTFSLINEYPGRLPLFHVDLYRLGPEEVEDLDLPELAARGVMVIEWAERLPFRFPRQVEVHLEILGAERRLLRVRR